mgnify:CR=1 FL=1
MRIKVFNGIRVLDLTRVLAGPYCSLILSDLGAEVIKIEPPDEPDPTRNMGPIWKGMSAYFISVNRNKKGMTLNLKKEEGLRIFYELVKKSDVVLDNFRPDVPEKLKIDYERISKINPKIISCSISSFGSDGPRAHQPAFDLSIQALSGAMSITGYEGLPPVRMGIPVGDLAGGLFGVIAISSALYLREKTGKGTRIDLSLLDCNISLLTYVAQYYFIDGKIPGRIGSSHQTIVPYQAFKTKDSYIVIAILTEKFWEKFVEVIELPWLKNNEKFSTNEERLKNKSELLPILEKRLEEKTTKEWLKIFENAEIPCAPVYNVAQALNDEQVKHRNMIEEINGLKVLGNPLRMEGIDSGEFLLPPQHGEHTEEILKNLLGMNDPEIKKLKEEGVI